MGFLDIFKNNRCKVCKENIGHRFCIRTNKKICWQCCNDFRSDFRCPNECKYHLKRTEGFAKSVSDSLSENLDLQKKLLDRWAIEAEPLLDNQIPLEMMKKESTKKELKDFLFKNAKGNDLLLEQINKKFDFDFNTSKSLLTFEDIAKKIIEEIIMQDWDFVLNAFEKSCDDQLRSERRKILESESILQKAEIYFVVSSAMREDHSVGLVLFDINQKHAVILALKKKDNDWNLNEIIFGDYDDYYQFNNKIQLFNTYLSKSQLPNAYDHLQKVERMFPFRTEVQYAWGLYYSISEDVEKAIASYKKAVILDEKNHSAWYNLGFIAQAKNEFEKAIDYYEKVLSLNPYDAGSLNNLSVIYEEKGDIEKAKKYMKKCLKHNPNFEIALKNNERLLKK